jgi:hypothetical protein
MQREPRVTGVVTHPKPRTEPSAGLGFPGRRKLEAEESSRGTIIAGVLGAALVLGAGLAYRFLSSPDAPSPVDSASASATPNASPTEIGRCGPSNAAEYTIGDAPKAPASDASASAADSMDQADSKDDTPFAAILGRAIPTDRGFAVPVLSDGEGGSVLSVVEIDSHGAGVSTRLVRSRGDLEPPVLFADGARLLGGALEPNASGLAMKLFTVEGGKVAWGAEVDQPRDESLAIDVAASGDRGVAVWDAVKDEKSYVAMVSFKRSDIGTTTAPRAITDTAIDADLPRVIPRSTGYFLLYRVRGEELRRTGSDEPRDPKPKKKKVAAGSAAASGATGADDDIDESQGEKDFATWIEAVRLDENGSPEGSPEVLTKRDGHVTGFDVTGSEDAFTLAWRDEDGPSGSVGGDVHLEHVTLGGPLPISTLKEKGEGGAAALEAPSGPHSAEQSAGVPVLLGTWVAVPTLRGHALLAGLDLVGAPTEKMSPEPMFGMAEPVAARTTFDGPAENQRRTDTVLVAEPHGRAMVLKLLTCAPPR